MPVDHYENFPVASLLMPARLRPAVEAVYAFARSADDLADEGDASPAERLAALDAYGMQLEQIAAGQTLELELFRRLAEVVQQYQLPLAPLHALLSAFKQDVSTLRYQHIEDLLDYCCRSANPVGRILLHLYGVNDSQSLRESDAICSALQLINFLQDVEIDSRKGRVYLPLDELRQFSVTETQIVEGRVDPAWRALMHFQVSRTRALLTSGAPLAKRLPGRLGWELRLVVQGGARILQKIEAVDYDIFAHRPKLHQLDWLCILWRSLIM
jgi:squalene synthase HpnC